MSKVERLEAGDYHNKMVNKFIKIGARHGRKADRAKAIGDKDEHRKQMRLGRLAYEAQEAHDHATGEALNPSSKRWKIDSVQAKWKSHDYKRGHTHTLRNIRKLQRSGRSMASFVTNDGQHHVIDHVNPKTGRNYSSEQKLKREISYMKKRGIE